MGRGGMKPVQALLWHILWSRQVVFPLEGISAEAVHKFWLFLLVKWKETKLIKNSV